MDELKPEDVTSDNLVDLKPKTERDYLMIMWPTQLRMLKHLEVINNFKEDHSARLSNIEGRFTIACAIIGTAMAGLALKVIFGS